MNVSRIQHVICLHFFSCKGYQLLFHGVTVLGDQTQEQKEVPWGREKPWAPVSRLPLSLLLPPYLPTLDIFCISLWDPVHRPPLLWGLSCLGLRFCSPGSTLSPQLPRQSGCTTDPAEILIKSTDGPFRGCKRSSNAASFSARGGRRPTFPGPQRGLFCL